MLSQLIFLEQWCNPFQAQKKGIQYLILGHTNTFLYYVHSCFIYVGPAPRTRVGTIMSAYITFQTHYLSLLLALGKPGPDFRCPSHVNTIFMRFIHQYNQLFSEESAEKSD